MSSKTKVRPRPPDQHNDDQKMCHFRKEFGGSEAMCGAKLSGKTPKGGHGSHCWVCAVCQDLAVVKHPS